MINNGPIKDGRHIRWTVDQRNTKTKLLSTPGIITKTLRRALDNSILADLTDPFEFYKLEQLMGDK